MTFIYKTLIIPSILDSCFNSSTVCDVKRVMILLDIKICAYDKNFSSIWTYMTMMLPRVRNHHGGNVYIRDLIDFDVTMSTSRRKIVSPKNVYIRDLIDFDVTMSTSRGKIVSPKNVYIRDFIDFDATVFYLEWFVKYSANVRRTLVDFSHAPLNEYSPSPNDKKQWSLVWFDFYKIPISKLEYKFQDKEYSEDIFSSGSALEDFICVVFVPDRNIFPAAYQEFMAEQYELDRKAKMTVLERESEDRRRLIQSQRIAEDMRVLQIDTRGMDPVDAAIINAQKAKIRAAYPPPPN
ncbi:hypothetical protein Tco_0860968 [Tanacetum coccineum]|uniref:Uncharacterized protein n=1 Tax=Tanacetum coccineum TaxID=301880 RepID=A0ABQ5BGE8_9ASTR